MSTSCSRALLFFRSAFSTVAAGNVKAQQPASFMRKGVETTKNNVNDRVAKAGVECGRVTKDVFWMKDPKTGNWLPETHFNQVDAVELREKFLSKPAKS